MSDIDHARSAVSDFMMAHDTMSRGSLCPPGIYANDQLVPSYCPSREDPQVQVNTGIDSIEAKIAVYLHQYSTHSITQTWLVEPANSKANGPASSGLPIADDKTSSTMSKQDQH